MYLSKSFNYKLFKVNIVKFHQFIELLIFQSTYHLKNMEYTNYNLPIENLKKVDSHLNSLLKNKHLS